MRSSPNGTRSKTAPRPRKTVVWAAALSWLSASKRAVTRLVRWSVGQAFQPARGKFVWINFADYDDFLDSGDFLADYPLQIFP
jgi:hypothetical protein